jgi:DNA mismatch repair protein MutS
VARAREILTGLERDELSRGGRPSLFGGGGPNNQQLGLFQTSSPAEDPVVVRLRDLDVNNLTPMQALALLADLKREAGG